MSHARIDVYELFGAYGTTLERERFEEVLHEADALTTRAVALAPDYAMAWDARSDVFSKQQRWDPALEANAVSLRLDPSNPNTYTTRALLLLWSGQAAASLPLTERALMLDPSNAGWLLMIQCHVYLMIGRLDDAITACEKSIGQNDDWLVYVYLDAAYAQKGETSKASATKAELLKRKPSYRSKASGLRCRRGLAIRYSRSKLRKTFSPACARRVSQRSRTPRWCALSMIL